MDLLHTEKLSILINARGGATFDDCIRDGIALSARERANVTVVHNGKEYRVILNELFNTVQHP